MINQLKTLIDKMRLHKKDCGDHKGFLCEVDNLLDKAEEANRKWSIVEQEHMKMLKVLRLATDAAQFFFWIKDIHGGYFYANHWHCRHFFHLPDMCDIQGRNDLELVKDFKERTGKEHSFGQACVSTDDYTFEMYARNGHRGSRFLEFGVIDRTPLILHVTKFVWEEEGEVMGTIGFAQDLSERCDDADHLLTRMEAAGRATFLGDGMYYISEAKHVCTMNDIEAFIAGQRKT